MRFSLTTTLGILLGLLLTALSIGYTTTNYGVFISLSSFLIVLGGSMCACITSFHATDLLRGIKTSWFTIIYGSGKTQIAKDNIKDLVALAREVKQHGIAVLEDKTEDPKYANTFDRYALNIVTAGYTEKEFRYMLENFIQAEYDRNSVPASILQSAATFAPAFGMIGTLIGLIVMLDGLGGDPTKLGSGLALALNTTLYGVLAANLFFKPISNKITLNNQSILYRNSMLMEGYILIAQDQDPLLIQDRLNSFLDINKQFDLLNDT